MKDKNDIQIVDSEEMALESMDNKKIKKIKKKIIRIFLVIILLIMIVIFPIFFYKKELNSNLLSPQYKKGVFHVHTVFSDGTGNMKDISQAAKSNNIDFVIVTDHGKPNVKCSESTGWDNGLLLIGGSEFSLNCGHLACAGYGFKEKPDYVFPPEPQEAINDLNKEKGISFISHPLDGKIPWTDWDIEGFTGIEILNSYSSAKKTSILNILQFPLQYLFNKNYALLNTVSYPEDNLKLLDDFNKKGDYLGIYALDAHSKLPITKKFYFEWPSYKAMFKIFQIYVKIGQSLEKDPEYSAELVIEAMKKGNFFNVIEAISSANGFETFFIEQNGSVYDLGSKIQNTVGDILIKLPFAFKTDIIVKKDGNIFKEIKNNYKKELRVKVKEKGTYRLEIFVTDNSFNDLPWILTNPFFIGKSNTKIDELIDPQIKKPIALSKNSFTLEKNKNTEADLLFSEEEENSMKLEYSLKKDLDKRDFWVALAYRKKSDFSGFSGIVFKARSEEARRFWLEIRTENSRKELSYRHSFLPDKEWKKIKIPFGKFFLIREKGVNLDLSKINSLFFTINNAIAYKGANGLLELKDLGLY